ncbi:MAG: menaquinone biosynthesis protein [Planctomycetota bacterium]
MTLTAAQTDAAPPPPERPRVGCVSYLNAKPLIHGLDDSGDIELQLDVPSRLADRLTTGHVDLALCSTVDHFRGAGRLELVPVGGIACGGPTLTVRLFSRVPVEQITAVHADTDSHTSVALLRVLLHDLYGIQPELIHYDARARRAAGRALDLSRPPQSMLLIGDKVVTDAPSATVYPYQLDLGGAWHDLTGQPFVFAVWMKRVGTDLGGLPRRLAALLDKNLDRLDTIVTTYAIDHGWPVDLADQYLGQILRYRLGDAELGAIEHFGKRLEELGILASSDSTQSGSLTRG